MKSGSILSELGGNSGAATDFLIAEPLPVADFASQVKLVIVADFMVPNSFGFQPPTLPPSPPWLKNLNHISISIPFAIAPVRSGGYSYHQAPIVKQGISVQVQSLDFSPSRTTFYGKAGGARIELLFSGLPVNMELLSFVRLLAKQSIAGGTEGDYGPGR